MKYLLSLICFCFCLFNCNNNSIKNNNIATKPQSVDSLNNASIATTEPRDSLEAVADLREFALDSAWAIYKNDIPQSDYDEVFKIPFYKHYTGTFNDEPAQLNLTLSCPVYNGQFAFSGSLVLEKTHQLIQLFGRKDERRNEDNRINIWFTSTYQLDSFALPIHLMKGAFSDGTAKFKGLAMNEQTLKPLKFDFMESYTEGAYKFDLMTFGESKQYKNVNTRYLLHRFKGVDTDGSDYYLLEKNEGNNTAKSALMNYDSACFKFKNAFLKHRKVSFNNELDTLNGHFDTGIGLNYSADIISNSKKIVVVEYNKWQTDAESYGDFWTNCQMYDVEKNILLNEKDIVKPNYRNVLIESARKHYSWMVEDDAYKVKNSLKFAAVTKEGLIMLGTGNHGWYCSYFFFPMAEIKEGLKESFIKKYLTD